MSFDKATRYNNNYTERLILEPKIKSRANANQIIITMGAAADGLPSSHIIIFLLALALDFTLGSKICPSVPLLLYLGVSSLKGLIKPILIIFSVALAMDFTLGSKIYPSV